jgi:hypothetical protein
LNNSDATKAGVKQPPPKSTDPMALMMAEMQAKRLKAKKR